MSASEQPHCSRCGSSTPQGAKFCSECGAQLQPQPPQHALNPSRKVATVLFADLKGSTQAISAIDAEAAMLRIRPLIIAMATAVREHGGTVVEVRGDGILSGFGALDSLDDHALAACRAALAIRQSAKSNSPTNLPVRIGIHTGEVIVSPGEAGNSLIGATVHLASRLEQAAEPNTILVSEAVYQAVSGAAEVQPRGRFTFKGFDRPVATWELIDIEHRSRWTHRASLGLTPYCGRLPERALLKSFVEQTKEAAGRGTLCVVGDPGTGKSRFIHDSMSSGLLDSCTVWLAESELPARHSPYAIARSIARRWLGLTEHNTPLDVERRLSAILLQFGEPLSSHAPALKALLNLNVTDTDWTTFDLIDRKRRLASAFLEVCRQQIRYRPLFIVIDDAQWCDTETIQLLAEFAQQTASVCAGLILLARPDGEQPLLEAFPNAMSIHLRELTGTDTQDFLAVLLGIHPSLDPIKRKLTELTGGLPFFLEESIRYLVRNGILIGEKGNYSVAATVDTLNIPETVEALVSSRISSLPPDVWSVLSAAAVVGRTAPLSLIARVCDSTIPQLQPRLQDLEQQHIISVSEQRADPIFEFRHEFFRQVAYGMTLSSTRVALHAKTLRQAEVLFANRVPDWISFLVYHATLASLHADAARYCRIAAEHAVLASSYSAASDFCEQAVRHLEVLPQTKENIQTSIDIRLLLRVATGATSDFQRWLHHLSKAIELAEQIGDTPRRLLALIHRTWALNFSSSAFDAVRAGEEAVGFAQSQRIHASEMLARFALAQALFASGAYQSASKTLVPVIEWLSQGHETEQFGTTGTTLVLCIMMEANAHAAMGLFPVAESGLTRLEDLANRTRRTYDQVALSYCRGMVWGGQGKVEPAINALENGYDLCRKHSVNLFLPLIAASLANLLLTIREVSQASDVALLGLDVAEKLGHNIARSAAATALAAARLAQGDHRESIRLASEARSAAKAHGHRGVDIAATRALAQAFARSNPNDLERPIFLLQEAIDLAEYIQAIPSAAACGLILIRKLSKNGQHDQAIVTCERLITLTEQQGMAQHTAPLRSLLAEMRGGTNRSRPVS
jgi:class 3 adenylate cyclase/tetratricopeptide (TPR) repeat protein